jgi:hypothetical protein
VTGGEIPVQTDISAFPNRHTRWLACGSPEHRDPQEVVMSPTVTSLDQIDLEIALAYVALGVARGAYARCPSGENAGAVEEAEAVVDRLLDQRLAAQG